MEIRRIKGNDSAYFGRFNNRTVILVYHIFNSAKVTIVTTKIDYRETFSKYDK